MADRLTRLKDLVVSRVAFVSVGDNPGARILMWKERNVTNKEQTLKGALEALSARVTTADASLSQTVQRAEALSGAPASTVTKAAASAGRLRAMAERYLDRHPTDAHGRDRSLEQALAEVAQTREGRRAMAEVEEEGRLGKEAFEKAFGLEVKEPKEPEPTHGERKLDKLAKEYAAEHKVTREQALTAVVASPEGRAAYREHKEAVAVR